MTKKYFQRVLYLLILAIIAVFWMMIPKEFIDKFEWITYVPYIFSVPLCYFLIAAFSKNGADNSFQKILFITAGVVISLLLDRNFELVVFLVKVIIVLVSAIITYFLNHKSK